MNPPHGGDVVDRVAAGKNLTVTRSGKPVAELRPVGPLISTITLAELSVGPSSLEPTPNARDGSPQRSYDAMIAAVAVAVAVANDLPLSTSNPDDVTTIGQLRVINVAHPAA